MVVGGQADIQFIPIAGPSSHSIEGCHEAEPADPTWQPGDQLQERTLPGGMCGELLENQGSQALI